MMPVSRRELLAGITAAGAAGALSGIGTAALLVDRETLAASATAGRVDLRVDAGDGPTDTVGGPVVLPVPALEPGDTAETELTFSLPDEADVNPAYLWVRAGCGARSTLGSHLDVTLSRLDGAAATLYDGSLDGFLGALADGIPLDDSGAAVAAGGQACLQPGATVELRLRYELATDYVGDESTSLLLEGAAVQCRWADATERPPAFDAPLGLADCAVDCPCCPLVGKYEVTGDRLDAGTYPFTEGTSAYRLLVSDVETDDEGEPIAGRFRLVRDDGTGSPIEPCTVLIKSGNSPHASTDLFVYEGAAAAGVVGTDRHAISYVAVGRCTARVGDDCPEDAIKDPRDGKKGKRGEGGKHDDDHDDDWWDDDDHDDKDDDRDGDRGKNDDDDDKHGGRRGDDDDERGGWR